MRNNVDSLGVLFYTRNVIIISQKSTLLYHASIIHTIWLFLWICKLGPMSWDACSHEMCPFYWTAMRYYEDLWPFKGKCNMHLVCLHSGKKNPQRRWYWISELRLYRLQFELILSITNYTCEKTHTLNLFYKMSYKVQCCWSTG